MTNPLAKWLWQVAVVKGVKNAVKVAVAWLTAHGLRQAGVTIDEAQLTVFLVGVLEVARNFLKVKKGWAWL